MTRSANQPKPVDPSKLDPASRERREKYKQALKPRRRAAAEFVPRHLRDATKDEKGRVVTRDDNTPTWLRTR